MSKKGLSAEDKANRMLQLLHEKGECFQIKELEKIAPKEKGIVANSVKQVLQKLVEDGLIDNDKIGSTDYYWAFQSKAVNTRKRKLEELQTELEKSNKKLKIVEENLAEIEVIKDENYKRNKILDEINDMEIKLHESKRKLKEHYNNDPEKYKAIINKTQELKEATNRWTDNIFAIKSWCKNKFSIDEETLNKQFAIPEDFDYIE